MNFVLKQTPTLLLKIISGTTAFTSETIICSGDLNKDRQPIGVITNTDHNKHTDDRSDSRPCISIRRVRIHTRRPSANNECKVRPTTRTYLTSLSKTYMLASRVQPSGKLCLSFGEKRLRNKSRLISVASVELRVGRVGIHAASISSVSYNIRISCGRRRSRSARLLSSGHCCWENARHPGCRESASAKRFYRFLQRRENRYL